jgi:hypothetical protein
MLACLRHVGDASDYTGRKAMGAQKQGEEELSVSQFWE